MVRNTISMISIPFFILLSVEFSIQTRENDRWGTGVSRQYRGCPLPRNDNGTVDLRLLDEIAINASQNDNTRDMSGTEQPLMEIEKEVTASTNRAPLGKRSLWQEPGSSRDEPVPKKATAPRFSCETCAKSYSTKGNLKKHENVEHKGFERYKCAQCTKTFGRKEHLTHHLKWQHTNGIKKRKCEFCNVEFNEGKNLKVHIRALHGNETENEYPCPHCNGKYKYKKNLRKHMLKWHNVADALCPEKSVETVSI